MALGTRELLLVIRARDEASRALHSMTRSMREVDRETRKAADAQIERGRALSSIGVGMMAVGAAGAKVLYDWAKAAIAYNKESAKTLTQVDKQKISLEEIRQVGIDVAKAIPAPFEQMQESLFSIFSSMDVDLKGARKLLTEFSKAAVAGQVDLQDAARGTIGILNAYRMGADGVNRVNDVMFELVRKGVGTYAEFSKVMGRAVPSAVRAGQSIENLAGMMAFLTRNGLSTAMAAASAARALDAISHPNTIKKFGNMSKSMEEALGSKRIKQFKDAGINLDKMGVKIRNASGQFRPMNAIMTDLGKRFKELKLTGPEIAAVLQELFKGSGGTIQARRFFDTAVKGYSDLNSLTKSMRNSSGAMKNAYDIMFKQPQTQMQLLKNNYEILKVEMGQALLPAILEVVKGVSKLFQWFNNLSDSQKKWITWIVVGATALMLIVGAVVAVVGVVMMFVGAAAALGISLGTVGLIILGVIAFIAQLVAIVWLVIKYWDPIKGFFIGLWNAVSGAVVSAWNKIYGVIQAVWPPIWNVIKIGWNVIVTIFKLVLAIILTGLITQWRLFGKPIMDFFEWAWSAIKWAWDKIVAIFKWVFNNLVATTRAGWGWLKEQFQKFWNWAQPYVRTGIRVLQAIWRTLFGPLVSAAQSGWNRLKSGLDKFWNGMKAGFRAGVKAVSAIWNTIKKPLAGPVNFLINTIWNNGIAKSWNTAVKLVDLPAKFRAPHLSGIKAASGGYISGPGGPTADKIPAMLSNGEFVVRASQTKRWLPVLQAINSGFMKNGIIPGFKDGGLLGKITGAAGFLKDVFMDPLGAIKKLLSYPLRALSQITGGQWGQVVAAAPKRMVDMMVKGFKVIFDKYGLAGVQGVVKAAQRWIGVGDTGGDNNNMFTKRWGMPGAPWCAMFVSSCVEAAKAGKLYKGYPTAAVAGYAGAMKHISPGAGRPGDLIAYRGKGPGGWGHINIIEKKLGLSTYGTIGGNEGPKVKRGIRSPGAILRPGMATGGLVDAMFEDNFDRRDRRNPMLKAYRIMLADSGAYLRPGMNVVMNHTGGMERILSRAETSAYEGRGGRGLPPIIVNTNEIDPRRHAAELGWELERRVV